MRKVLYTDLRKEVVQHAELASRTVEVHLIDFVYEPRLKDGPRRKLRIVGCLQGKDITYDQSTSSG
jgi:hypothetical protein